MKLRDLFILTSGMAAVTQISAISLGNSQGSVQLGAPIDLVFQLQPDAKQTPESSCLRADIWMGDHALSRNDIQLIPQKNSVRIRTTSAVYEPLITVKLHAGCSGSIARSYTFFADPPKSLAATAEPIDLHAIQTTIAPSATTEPAPRTAINKPRPAPAVPPLPRVKKTPPPAPTKPPKTLAPAVATPPAHTPEAVSNTAAPTNSEKPRLRLEPMLTSPAEGFDNSRLRVMPIEGLDTPELATGTDAQTQFALNANTERLEGLEKQLKSLQTQLLSNRSEINSLQAQLAQAQNQDLPIWIYVILVLLALALAAIAWLLQRLKQERKTAQDLWSDAVLAADGAQPRPLTGAPAPSLKPSIPSTTQVEVKAEPTPSSVHEPRNTTASADDLYAEFDQLSAARPPQPSVSEVLTNHTLFDVQEQAEFYASIGENDQAIEILQTHIAAHQNSSPLAYIELLQLLYRLSRTDAFEHVRAQFQTHFNVQVPDFLGFSRKGSDLWSGYPDVLSKIEALWPTDDIQPLLHHLIVRQPVPSSVRNDVRFELAAFDDLLMLYNVVQTTSANTRGELPGRTRTSPTDIPFPEIVLEPKSAPPSDPRTAASPTAEPIPSLEPLSLHEAHLDLLNAEQNEAPLSSPTQLNDSPFQGPTHFTPDEVLMDSLSLDWTSSSPPASPTDKPDAVSSELSALEKELGAFMMDDRDLPAPRKPK